MMGLSDGRKSFRIGLAVLIEYRSVTATQPASHVAVAITLKAKASSLKTILSKIIMTSWVDQFQTVSSGYTVFLSFQMYVNTLVIYLSVSIVILSFAAACNWA